MRRRGLLSAALATAEAFLLEPAEPATRYADLAARDADPATRYADPATRYADPAARAGDPPSGGAHPAFCQIHPPGQPFQSRPGWPRPVVAVFGLAKGCGTTVVARAVGAALAERDPGGTATVSSERRAGGLPLATQSASRLARQLEDIPGAGARAVGRLCLVRGAEPLALADGARLLAPLVIDAGSSSLGGVAASVADRLVLVTTPALEPALAPVAAAVLARVAPEPILVLNRAGPAAEHYSPTAAVPGSTVTESVPPPGAIVLPDSRMGAQLALGGRRPRGELGRAIAHLTDVLEGGS